MNTYSKFFQNKRFLRGLYRDQHKVLVIHYSCESLTDNNQGYSPRITSIAVQNLRGDFQKSFSIHLEAEINEIPRSEIERHFDVLELKMLENFYSFVKDNLQWYWINWNMSNVNYGFEAIEHRYKVLKGKNFVDIPIRNRVNIPLIFSELYGHEYVSHPKMYTLFQHNFPNDLGDLLNGDQEVMAFKNKEFLKLHKSTLIKTSRIAKVVQLAATGKLKMERKKWGIWLEALNQHPLIILLTILATILSLVAFGGIHF